MGEITMIKAARIVENATFRTVDLHLETKSYSIRIMESEIDDELRKRGFDPVRQRLYASPVTMSRNMIAQDLAEDRLLEIMEYEIIGQDAPYEYTIKNASDWDSVQSHQAKLPQISFLGQMSKRR